MNSNDLFNAPDDDYSDLSCKFCEYPAGSRIYFYEEDLSSGAKQPYKISVGNIFCVCIPFLAVNDPQIYIAVKPHGEPDTRLIVPHSHIVEPAFPGSMFDWILSL